MWRNEVGRYWTKEPIFENFILCKIFKTGVSDAPTMSLKFSKYFSKISLCYRISFSRNFFKIFPKSAFLQKLLKNFLKIFFITFPKIRIIDFFLFSRTPLTITQWELIPVGYYELGMLEKKWPFVAGWRSFVWINLFIYGMPTERLRSFLK